MPDGTMLDLRRTDLRSNVLENPYWITSASIEKEADDKDAVLFSFPITKLVAPGYGNSLIILHMMTFEVTEAYVGGSPDILVGVGSLATDDITTDGAVTDVDVDEYFETGDITVATPAHYPPNGGNYLGLIAAQTFSAYASLVPADTTVLCIEAQLTSGEAITAGTGRLHVLLSVVPTLR